MVAALPEKKWTLASLLAGIADVDRFADVQLSGICQTNRDVKAGDLFLALAGRHQHGLQYIDQVRSAGAAAIGWEPTRSLQLPSLPNDFPCIPIENLTARIGELAARFYQKPSTKLKVMAVTGTDGKSSVCHLLAQALGYLQHRCGVVGTLGAGLLSNLHETGYTTPPATLMQQELHRLLVEDDCEYVSIEASSHALDQNRLAGVQLDTGILTNITRDHMDYHVDRKNYIAAKARLFFESGIQNCVLNLDDQTGNAWAQQWDQPARLVTYSCLQDTGPADEHIYAREIELHRQGSRFTLVVDRKHYVVNLPLYGAFNVQNALAIAAVLFGQGFDGGQISAALAALQPVCGRMQMLAAAGSPTVIVDYAHTPAALEAALSTVRRHFSGQVYCVFGCGGERDRGKRSEMGNIASRLADYTVITSDNPRNEDPQQILDEVQSGLLRQAYREEDRSKAIEFALHRATEKDVVLIAGKGHETYQEVAGERIHFSDLDYVQRMLGMEPCHG